MILTTLIHHKIIADIKLNLKEKLAGTPAPTLIQERIRQLDRFADILEQHREEFLAILRQINTAYGAEYELQQAVKTLRGVKHHEQQYLLTSRPLENVAVYGSRNIPLYTLVMHGLIPATISTNVWLRTPSMTSEIYHQLYAKLTEYSVEQDLSNLHLLPPLNYDQFRKKLHIGAQSEGQPDGSKAGRGRDLYRQPRNRRKHIGQEHGKGQGT